MHSTRLLEIFRKYGKNDVRNNVTFESRKRFKSAVVRALIGPNWCKIFLHPNCQRSQNNGPYSRAVYQAL